MSHKLLLGGGLINPQLLTWFSRIQRIEIFSVLSKSLGIENCIGVYSSILSTREAFVKIIRHIETNEVAVDIVAGCDTEEFDGR